jgi:hypothetical protein
VCVCVCVRVFVALVMQHARRMRHIVCHMWAVWLCHIFPYYLIDGTILGKILLNIKCRFLLSVQILSEIFLILRRIERDVIINLITSACKVPVILVRF